MDGTFYNSGGLFGSIEKRFNEQNSLTLTFFGGPTQRATGRPTVQEAYDLAGTNLYNPDWGYQNGDKRSARITETFDPLMRPISRFSAADGKIPLIRRWLRKLKRFPV